MGLILKHVKHDSKAGSWHYRRAIPQALREVMGKREQKKKLGSSEQEAIKAYSGAHKLFEAELEVARLELVKRNTVTTEPQTTYNAFRKAMEIFIELGFDPDATGLNPDDAVDEQEALARDVVTEGISQKYPQDPDTGYPIGVSPVDTQLVRLLNSDGEMSPPPVTFLDAVELYIEHKLQNDGADKIKIQRCRRTAGYATSAWNHNPQLRKLSYLDGMKVLKHLQTTTTQASATHKRYFNDLKSIVNYAIRVLNLKDINNPFSNVEIKVTGRKRDERRSFTSEELVAVRNLVLSTANKELQLIWRLMEGTGCRNGEICGLEAEDIKLDGNIPYLIIQPNDTRKLKTNSSNRDVPLVGDALEAAREAIAIAGENSTVFMRYTKGSRSSDRVSASLMKYVRQVTTDRRVTTYSLRHCMSDRLRLAGVSDTTRRGLLGHSNQGAAESYGSHTAYRIVLMEAMEKAMALELP